jgi:hypothetical protein
VRRAVDRLELRAGRLADSRDDDCRDARSHAPRSGCVVAAKPPAESPEPPAAASPPPAPAPSAPEISLEELGQRIKETPVIGTFTKLSLKNDIDDLVDDLRAYHAHNKGDIGALHERYESLVLKLLTLLEEDEPELALALSRSREEIWSRLVNPVEFAKLPT